MTSIILTSPGPNAGKTTLAVALGQRYRRRGYRVGYRRTLDAAVAREDAAFVRSALQITEPVDELLVPPGSRAIPPSADLDLLLIETSHRESARPFLDAPGVRSLIVARFQADQLAETVIEHARGIGTSTTSVLINVAPEKGMRQLRQRVIPALEAAHLPVIGVLPQDRVLLGTTVEELATALAAEVLCAHDQLNRPVEAVMIAAMSDEGAEEYFRRLDRKVVVAAGDRPDIHLPALATDTSCLVLSQGLDPDPTVLKTADESGVPLLKVSANTFAVLDQIADHFGEVRFHQRHKIGPAVALLRAQLDEATLDAALGIAHPEAS